MHSSPPVWLPLLLSALLTAGLLHGCSGDEGEELPAGGGEAGGAAAVVGASFVPDRQCAECHPRLWESYQEVAMAKSWYPPAEDNRIEDFEDNRYYHEASRRWYEMSWRDGAMFIKRWQVDEEGRRYHEIERQVTWIVGSGNHVRSYLHQTELGELYQLPICWYSQTGEWAMAPGFDFPDHFGFQRPVSRDCVFCHNALPDFEPGSDRFGEPLVYSAEMPHGLGCQRCHGPGSAHIELANDPLSTLEAVRTSLVNPARLDAEAQEDICFQCHYQPTAKRSSIFVRFGEEEFGYRPGDPLDRHLLWLDFDEGRPVEERFEINHHAFRLEQSRCYQESERLLCTSCHDPHRKVAGADAPAFYRERCFQCHASDACGVDSNHAMAQAHDGEEVDLQDCVACHMPKRRPEDVVHAVMTDHLIQRSADRAAFLEERREDPPDREAPARLVDRSTADGEDLYRFAVAVRDGDRAATPQLAAALADFDPGHVEPWVYLGQGQATGGDYSGAEKSYRRVLEIGGHEAVGRQGLGRALLARGESEDALTQFRRVLELWPDSPEAHLDLGRALIERGQLDAARASFQRALALRPNFAAAHEQLANLAIRANQMGAAESHLRQSLTLEPTSSSAWLNLGSALGAQGRHGEAVAAWRLGAVENPDDARLLWRLSMSYLLPPVVELASPPEGMRFARQASRAAPRDPLYALTVAFAAVQNTLSGEALGAAAQARTLGADEASCSFVEAIAYFQLEQQAEAEAAFARGSEARRDPPVDPRVRQALERAASAMLRQ